MTSTYFLVVAENVRVSCVQVGKLSEQVSTRKRVRIGAEPRLSTAMFFANESNLCVSILHYH